MGSLVLDRFSGEFDDRHTFILEGRLSYGLMTYGYDAPNPFSVEGESVELWAKGGVFETTLNGIYQYTINDVFGLRFGFGFPILWSGVLAGEKPGLSGKGSDSLAVTIGAYGILGVTIFPKKKFPIVFTISPGVILNPYWEPLDDKSSLFPFNMPISLVIGWNGLIDN
jgi:hypothetical protein